MSPSSITQYHISEVAVMLRSQEGNRRSGVTLAMTLRFMPCIRSKAYESDTSTHVYCTWATAPLPTLDLNIMYSTARPDRMFMLLRLVFMTTVAYNLTYR